MTESPRRNLQMKTVSFIFISQLEHHRIFPFTSQYQTLPISFIPSHQKTGGKVKTYIFETNLSLLTGLPFFPWAFLGVSIHISFTFSSTMLQCLSNAFTLASNFRLFRQEIRTCACDRTAVCKIDNGPEVNSCSSS